jgi:hypothetical protein
MSTRAAERALTPIALRSEHDARADGIAIGPLLRIPTRRIFNPFRPRVSVLLLNRFTEV